jgi:hypothetical protein
MLKEVVYTGRYFEFVKDILRACEEKPERYARQIRRLAGCLFGSGPHKARSMGLWYFADENNLLISIESGLDGLEALTWLLSRIYGGVEIAQLS